MLDPSFSFWFSRGPLTDPLTSPNQVEVEIVVREELLCPCPDSSMVRKQAAKFARFCSSNRHFLASPSCALKL